MNSFTLIAIGNLADTPKLEGKGDSKYAKFALIGNDYAGPDKDDVVTTVYFVAFGNMAETIAQHARKGDQLILEAQQRANNHTNGDTGETVYRYSNIVQSFKFGAPGQLKREEFAKAR